MTRAKTNKQRVYRAAMLVWKYDPVSAGLAGYSRRYRNLMKACEACARVAREKGKKP